MFSSFKSLPKLRCRQANSRAGAAYVVVLGGTLIVSALSFGAIMAVHAQRESIHSHMRAAEARQYALSAIELGLQEMSSNRNWRTTHRNDPQGLWFQNRPIGGGTCTLKVVNPLGALDRSETDSVTMTATGAVNGRIERQVVELPLTALLQPYTSLQTAETSAQAVSLGTTSLAAVNQIISSNASGTAFTSGAASIYACVEAVGTITGGTYYQTPTTSGAAPRTMPDPNTVFEYYLANGTVINYLSLPTTPTGRTITNKLLSPNANPFGPSNPQGIYVIDCGGGAITFAQNRIVGTIVLLNPAGGTASYYQNQNYHVPAVENFPALLVRGDFSMRMNTASLAESTGVNFNPPGTPYPWPAGSTDADVVDSYPNQVDGLIYVSGNFQTQTQATLGQVICNGAIAHQNGGLTLRCNSIYYSNPPPGFYTIKMIPGIHKRATN